MKQTLPLNSEGNLIVCVVAVSVVNHREVPFACGLIQGLRKVKRKVRRIGSSEPNDLQLCFVCWLLIIIAVAFKNDNNKDREHDIRLSGTDIARKAYHLHALGPVWFLPRRTK